MGSARLTIKGGTSHGEPLLLWIMKVKTKNHGVVVIDIYHSLSCVVRYHSGSKVGNNRISLTHSGTGKRKYFKYDHSLPSSIHEQAAYHLAINGIEVRKYTSLKGMDILIIATPDAFNKYYD